MLAEEKERNDGAQGPTRARARARPGSRGAPGRPAPAAAAGKRRRPPGECAAEPVRERGPARKRRRSGRRRAQAEGSPAGPGEPRAESGQRPDAEAAGTGHPARRRGRRQRRNTEKSDPPAGPGGEQGPEPAAGAGGRSASLRARMEERLLSARFRFINEQLYTCSSREAARLFQSDPDAFHIYHRGFAQQVARWPQSPVQRIVQYLRRRPASLVVADFGCGDCTLANSVKNKVHCFDLVPLSPRVTVCDMAQVPLAAESVDVAVFCLALMGTNLQEILEEANRVLKPGGTLMVAEVASRFEDIRAFLSAMARLGFKSVSKDLSSPFFLLLEFAKTGPPRPGPATGLRLQPCRYKRR